ncbi:MAG: glycosyltransferase [Candidatus Latescibacteria bacterium]|nr:glycosyltransferase [Candidatus Latescibacterota bacterium]
MQAAARQHEAQGGVLAPTPGAPSVAFLITGSGLGGAEFEVRHLALAFQRRGWGVGLISMQTIDVPFADLESMGIRTVALSMRRGIPDPRALLRLRAVLKGWQPDVLHGHMVHANLLARVSKLLVDTKAVISTIHCQDEGGRWRYAAYRLTDRLSSLTTAVSRIAVAEATQKRAAAPDSILFVPNGLVTADYAADEEARARLRRELDVQDGFLWLAVGRLAEQKNYPNMFAAFARVLESHPDARLVIAGKGPLEEQLQQEVESRGLQGPLRLLGIRRDIPKLMQAADGFVMSSDWEGLPIVLLEAGASALPIVATRVAGSEDAIAAGSSGLLCEPRDSAGLAASMVKVMELPLAERLRMGQAGRNHVQEHFELEAVASTWEYLYRQQLTK